ncbi:MAG TPA: hypothetical protein VLA97_04990 [Nocardioidaceae bacterium]|nr:hypothetical protein [Nocardioidaceae bacterium]HSE70095.1 hypothetical protein [Nocardioidaceae bacterium]
MSRRRISLLTRPALSVTVLALLLLSCTPTGGSGTATSEGTGTDSDTRTVSTQTRIEPGTGSFVYAGAEKSTGQPIQVYYDAPASADLDTAQILIVVHGHGRDAASYRDSWVPLVEDRNVLVLVPEFPSDEFSDTEYNLGNMVDEDGEERPEDEWTFAVIEALFEHVREQVDSKAEDYVMFGHSAGAQFVHRFVQFGSPEHLRTAVAANAGWYTVPDDSEDFPYGLDGIAVDEEDLEGAFSTDMVVMLGADDIDPESESLRHDEQSDEQGDNRLERGLHYYREARMVADDHDLPFVWRLEVAPGIGHSQSDMARVAAPVLLGPPS